MKNSAVHFKLAHRYVLLRSLEWIAAAAGIFAIIIFSRVELLFLPRELHFFYNLELEEIVFLSATIAILGGKALVAFLYQMSFRITISEEGLALARGIVFRDHTLVPRSKITQIKVGRDLRHLICGLWFVDISVPASAGRGEKPAPLRIQGMRGREAMELSRLINISDAKEGAPAAPTRGEWSFPEPLVT